MKKLYIIFCVILMYSIEDSYSAPLILSSKNLSNGLPQNFRKIENSSASAQFSYASLVALKKYYQNQPLIVVDLRQETHFFINGEAIHTDTECNLGNEGKKTVEILSEEKKLVEKIKALSTIKLRRQKTTKTIILQVESVHTEQELAESLGIKYVRLPVADHKHPQGEIIEQFVQLVSKLPKNAIIHFHCSAGKGRSTTFLAMVDILHHAKYLTYKEILNKQIIHNGSDLSREGVKKHVKKNKCFDETNFLARSKFLEEFYKKYSHI